MSFHAEISNATTAANSFKNKKLTDKQAIDLALDYSKALFGENSNGYEVSEVKYIESRNNYLVTLIKKFGEKNFINGPYIFVYLLPNGNLSSCSSSRLYSYENFNFEKLNNITKNQIEKLTAENITLIYNEKINYNISSISLVEKNNNYYIYVIVNITKTDEELGEIYESKEFYYELD